MKPKHVCAAAMWIVLGCAQAVGYAQAPQESSAPRSNSEQTPASTQSGQTPPAKPAAKPLPVRAATPKEATKANGGTVLRTVARKGRAINLNDPCGKGNGDHHDREFTSY